MSEKQRFPTAYFIVTLVAASVVASAFGFSAGFIAGNRPVFNAMAGYLPPFMRGMMGAWPTDAPALTQVTKFINEDEATVAAVKRASPAVVSIVITKDVPVWEQYDANPFGSDEFFQQFFGNMMPGFQMPQYRQKGTEKQEVGAGSGFIVSTDGYIVTNRHVVTDEKAEYTAIMSDGTKYPAKVLARDPSNDIAVLKIEKDDAPVIRLGDSDAIQVGQRVIAIGYALGRFGNTVSTGVVSGVQRAITAGDGAGSAEDLYDVIQTDAAINPGNSGGPLLNLDGEAIGMNVAIVQGSQNIGFALPIGDVRKVVESVKNGGTISRAFLGVRYVMITKAMKDANQLPVEDGALVVRGDQQTDLAVSPGSPADKAGIVENDIILEVNGKKLTAENPLAVAIRRIEVGEAVTLKILHKGEEKTVTVVLVERK